MEKIELSLQGQSNITGTDMDKITEQQTRREMDMGIANAARGIVFHSLIKSIKEHGKESPETKQIEKRMDELTSVFEKVRMGDRKAIHYTRTELKKFVEENNRRIDLKATNGISKPDEFRPG